MKKIFKLLLISIIISTNAYAGSDGEIELSKKNKTTKDCFEKINRATFSLNQSIDKVIFKPAAKAYTTLPSSVRNGTGNVLDNLNSLITIPNNVLQGEFKKAGVNTGRFVVNSTIGILGIFDVADNLGFPEYIREDYGQTFGKWGIGEGCYLVLPILGPSTVRDTAGAFANIMGGDPWYNASINGNNEYLTDKVYTTSKILAGIDFRAKNMGALDNLEKNSMDFYASVKSLYLQDRQLKISNNNNFKTTNDSDWEEIDSN